MNLRLTIFLTICVFLFLIFIYRMINKSKLSLKYALLWVGLTFIMFITIMIPNFLRVIANIIGIETVSNMIFLVAVGFLLIISFILTTIVSKQGKKINILIQEIGILKDENKK